MTGKSAPLGRTAALVLLVITTVVWGVHWVVVKVGLEYMPPFTYAALRVGTGLGAVLALLGARGRLVLPPRRDLSLLVTVGLGQIAGGVVLMNLALQVVPPGRFSVLVYSMPLWVLLIQVLVFRDRPSLIALTGLALGLTGIALLLNPSSIDWTSRGELAGGLALLLSALAWAIATLHVRRHEWSVSPLDLHPWQLLVALIPLVLLALALEPHPVIRWEPTTILVLLYSGPLATAFAYWATQSITRSLGALASATGFLGAPVVGLGSSALLLGEPIGIIDVVAFGLVLLGIGIVSMIKPSPGAQPV